MDLHLIKMARFKLEDVEEKVRAVIRWGRIANWISGINLIIMTALLGLSMSSSIL
jgi:hypothetical protein